MRGVILGISIFSFFISLVFFFFNDTATTEIYTLSLHDALPISKGAIPRNAVKPDQEPFKAQCPTAYWGIKGDLLPTYWKAADKAQPAIFLKSQVLNQYLYCVYRIPSEDREVHVSVNRLIPEGYDCISDGVGRFECREKPQKIQPRR